MPEDVKKIDQFAVESNCAAEQDDSEKQSCPPPTDRAATNRRNARFSTGPKTESGKRRSRRNAIKHGLLASKLLISSGMNAEDGVSYRKLLQDLYRHFEPVGVMEDLLVQTVATCLWKQRRALECENACVRRGSTAPAEFHPISLEPQYNRDPLYLPEEKDLNRILRYQAANQRQLTFALQQLEHLQQVRRPQLGALKPK